MKVIIELQEVPGKMVAIHVRSEAENATALEKHYGHHLKAALGEVVIPTVMKQLGGKLEYQGKGRPGQN